MSETGFDRAAARCRFGVLISKAFLAFFFKRKAGNLLIKIGNVYIQEYRRRTKPSQDQEYKHATYTSGGSHSPWALA